MKLSRYQRLSAVEKRTEAIASIREPSVACPSCNMQLMPDDLLKHMDERCSGTREPHGGWKWATWADVAKLDVAAGTLHYWVQQGRVRRRGDRIDYQYLLRDIVLILAARRRRQRRNFEESKSEEPIPEGTK